MKKRIAGILTAALIGTTVMGTVVMAAPSGAIDVISREDGSVEHSWSCLGSKKKKTARK